MSLEGKTINELSKTETLKDDTKFVVDNGASEANYLLFSKIKSIILGIIDSLKVSKAGDTMTGPLKVPTASVDSSDTTVPNCELVKLWLSTKADLENGKVPDNQLPTKAINAVQKTGDTMTGPLIVPDVSSGSNDNTVINSKWANGLFVKKAGDTMSGDLIIKKSFPLLRGAATSDLATTDGMCLALEGKDANNKEFARIDLYRRGSIKQSEAHLIAENSSGTKGELAVFIDDSGRILTFAPTPASTSNTTEIATTAWVNQKISEFSVNIGYAPVQTAEEIAKQDAARKKSELTEIAVNAMMATLSGETVEKAKTEYTAKLNTIEDSVAMYMPEVFPVWDPNSVSYTKGQRVFYNNVLYKVLNNHTSQESWTPEQAPSLFVKVINSVSGEIPEWQQPSAENAYMKGERVKFEGKIYESLIDNNVWSPTAYPAGWKEVTDDTSSLSTNTEINE